MMYRLGSCQVMFYGGFAAIATYYAEVGGNFTLGHFAANVAEDA